MENILARKKDIDSYFYSIMLFKGSSSRSGISKKSGRPWKMVEIELSDGVKNIYCPQWDRDKALGWPEDTPVIAYGQISLDWRGRPTMSIKSIDKISSLIKDNK
jgi:hypothetical protein